jgi:hypothetical protein
MNHNASWRIHEEHAPIKWSQFHSENQLHASRPPQTRSHNVFAGNGKQRKTSSPTARMPPLCINYNHGCHRGTAARPRHHRLTLVRLLEVAQHRSP